MPERKDEQVLAEAEKPSVETGELRRASKSERLVDRIIPRDRPGNEVETWLQKIEKDPQQVQDDMGNNSSPLKPVPSLADDVFAIPVTRHKFVAGFKQNVEDVTRWLSVFVLRVIKKRDGKVKFLKEDKNG